ncbi:MAG: autotransporter assembly complex protein TamA [Steroidobacteraceae bacterium]
MAQRNSFMQALGHSRAALILMCLIAYQPVRANVTVELHGVDDELRTNVLAYLSFERYKKTTDLSADTIERLHERVEREVQSALRPFGYYDPKVHSELSDEGKGDWRITIDIDPGPPVLIDLIDVQVHGPGDKDALFTRITDNLPLHRGDRLSHATYDTLKGDLQRTAATYGYLDAKLTRNELIVDPRSHKASISLEMQTGERYRFGATTIQQKAVNDALVRRYLRYQQGEPFDLTEILRTQFALDDAQYFANLEVLPAEPDRDAHLVPVNIKADLSRRNWYSVGAGYATDTGPRGTLTWENRRINTRGHRFNVIIQAAQVTKYQVQSNYIIPIGDPAVEKLTLQGVVEQRDLADVTTRNEYLQPSITKVAGNWQYVWFVQALKTTGESAAETRTDRLLIPGIDIASVPKGYLGEPIFQHGLFLELKGADGLVGTNTRFVQAHLTGVRVFNFYPKWHLLLRDEIGATMASRFSQLPVVERFFAGGDNSVRGFAYNSLSPTENVCDSKGRNPDGSCIGTVIGAVKAGGKDIITGTVEVIRDLPRNFGVATFFDYGNAFNRFGGTPLEYSVGVGFRLRLPVVTLGVDIAQPISRPGASPRLHINFSPKL